MPRIRWTPERLAALRADAKRFYVPELARRHGTTEGAIRTIAAKHGIRLRRPSRFRSSDVKLLRVIERVERQEGEPISDLLRWYAARRYSRRFAAESLGIAYETLTKLAARYGISFETDRRQLKGSWPTEAAALRPALDAAIAARRRQHGITFRGETLFASEWSLRLGGSKEMVRKRLQEGWPLERALTTPARATRGGKRHVAQNHPWRRRWAA